MNIQVAVLCDAATNEHEKLNLLGAFDTIYARQFPATSGPLAAPNGATGRLLRKYYTLAPPGGPAGG